MALGGAGAACPCGDDGEHVDGVGQERDAETDSVPDDDQICGRDCGQGRFPPAARPAVFRRPNRVHPRPTLQVPLDSTLSHIEKGAILVALDMVCWKKHMAACVLMIGIKIFYSRPEEYRLS